MVSTHQQLTDGVVVGHRFEYPHRAGTVIGTACALGLTGATSEPGAGGHQGLARPRQAVAALIGLNGAAASVRIAARLRPRAKNNSRSVPWVLTILWLMTPVNGFAQASRTEASLEPTKPSQIVVLQSQTTRCPIAGGTGSWLMDIQTLPDGTTAYFGGVPTGQVLVLTGLSFVADRGGVGTETPQILLWNPSMPPSTSGPAPPVLFHTAVRADGVHRVGGVAALHNVVIKPGTVLCLFSDFFSVTGVVTGFLTTDR
jgi:hypothetical protein